MNAATELTPEILAAKIEEVEHLSVRLLVLARVVGECCHEGGTGTTPFSPSNADASTLAMMMVELADKQGEILDIPGGWEGRFKETQ